MVTTILGLIPHFQTHVYTHTYIYIYSSRIYCVYIYIYNYILQFQFACWWSNDQMGQNLGPQEDEQSKRRRRQSIFSWEEDLGTISTDESSGYCAKSWDWAEWCLIRHLWNLWGTCWNDVFLYGISSWMMCFFDEWGKRGWIGDITTGHLQRHVGITGRFWGSLANLAK